MRESCDLPLLRTQRNIKTGQNYSDVLGFNLQKEKLAITRFPRTLVSGRSQIIDLFIDDYYPQKCVYCGVWSVMGEETE